MDIYIHNITFILLCKQVTVIDNKQCFLLSFQNLHTQYCQQVDSSLSKNQELTIIS